MDYAQYATDRDVSGVDPGWRRGFVDCLERKSNVNEGMGAMDADVLILGGGLAGLSTAYHLGDRAHVLERGDQPGGMARSTKLEGFTFDCDGHLLHIRRPAVRKWILDLIGSELVRHRRDAWIYSHGTYTPYPFQANLHGLPPAIVKECLVGLAQARQHGASSGEARHFGEWVEQTFGSGLARHFFVPYNEKFWRRPLEDLTSDWINRFIPIPTLEEAIEGSVDHSEREFGYNTRFWYPKRGGMQILADALATHVPSLELGANVVSIDLTRRRVVLADGAVHSYRTLVSTIPLPALVACCEDVPASVQDAADQLRYISIWNLNWGIDRPMMVPHHWIYFPGAEHDFFRVGFQSNFTPSAAPEGAGSMYVEVSHDPDHPVDRDVLIPRIRQQLEQVGILRPSDRVLAELVHDIRYGYVVYDHAYRSSMRVLHDFYRQSDVKLLGRYGSWQYMSMEDVMWQGWQLATRLERRFETCSSAQHSSVSSY